MTVGGGRREVHDQHLSGPRAIPGAFLQVHAVEASASNRNEHKHFFTPDCSPALTSIPVVGTIESMCPRSSVDRAEDF